MAVELYAHNEQTYQNMVSMFESRNRVGVVQPTGTGKSFLYLKWIEDHPQDHFTILSPSTEIFTQLQEYAESSGAPDLLKSVQMISYQALLKMTDAEVQAIHPDKMVLDEFHRTGAELWGPSLQRLLDANPDAQVLGASATPVRYLEDGRDMASELFDRNLAVEMTLGEAVQRKILPTPKYVPVWYDVDGTMDRYQKDISRVANVQERRDLEDKLEQLKRRLESSYGAEDIFQKHMPHDHGKYIVFCRNKEHLEEMKEAMKGWLAGVNPNVRSYVSISAQEDKDNQLEAFKADKSEDAVKLLFTIDRLNEGLHVKGIDGVIMLRPTISPIIYLQQMGRALSVNHENPIIFDMVNNYQSVQIPMKDGSPVNVFEKEFAEAMEQNGDTEAFRIFEDMAEFTALFSTLESKLYLSFDAKWDVYLAEAMKYREEHGDINVHQHYVTPEGVPLGQWISRQRGSYNSSTLSQDRQEKLEAIGMVWDPVGIEWDRMYAVAKEYFDKHGDLEVPQRYTTPSGDALGYWVSTQRGNLRKGILTDEKIQKLEAIKIRWNVKESNWDEMFSSAQDYLQKHGNLNIPSDYKTPSGQLLASWLNNQKTRFKQGKLSPERIEKLNSIGFVWSHLGSAWDAMFAEAKKFAEANGHLRPPKDFRVPSGKSLGHWIIEQRKDYTFGKMDPQRQKLLESIGIEWKPRGNEWNEMYQYASNYFHTHGNLLVPHGCITPDGRNLGGWVVGQRTLFNSGALSVERKEKLDLIGMAWDKHKAVWDHMYSCAQQYVQENGHCRVPYAYVTPNGDKLGGWIANQRTRYRTGALPIEYQEKLNAIGMEWSLKPTLTEQMAGAASKAGRSSGRGGKGGHDGPGGR